MRGQFLPLRALLRTASPPSRLRCVAVLRARQRPRRQGLTRPRRARSVAGAASLLKIWGRNELEEKSKPKWLLFLEQARAAAPSFGRRGSVPLTPWPLTSASTPSCTRRCRS